LFLCPLRRPLRIELPAGALARVEKGETIVPDKNDDKNDEKNETTKTAEKAAGLGISLDSWAVALALGLALLVWVGWIKRVPW
jgi:hypothetical protein